MFFGKKLKDVRLKSGIGLREMSKKLDMAPSKYCNIEHGYEKPPYWKLFLARFVTRLGKDNISWEDKEELYYLAQEPFVMQKMPEYRMIAHATKSDGSMATPDDLINLSDYINDRAKEHNKKAEEYNKNYGTKR